MEIHFSKMSDLLFSIIHCSASGSGWQTSGLRLWAESQTESLMQTPHLQVLVLEMRGLELPLHNLFSILIPTIWMDCKNIELGYGIISWDWKLLFAAMVSFGCEKYIHCESAQRSISEAEFKQYSMFISFKWEASLSSTHAHCDLKQSMFYPQIAFFCSPKYSTTAFNFLIHSWGLNPINVISDINRGIHSF